MNTDELPDDAPATDLFPQFGGGLYQMVSSELAGLTDEQASHLRGAVSLYITDNLSVLEQSITDALAGGVEVDTLSDQIQPLMAEASVEAQEALNQYIQNRQAILQGRRAFRFAS